MVEILRESFPVARKEYRCGLCGGIIHKGESYKRQTDVCDGTIYDFICHKDCDRVASALELYWLDESYDYGLSPETFCDSIYEAYVEEVGNEDEEESLTTYEQVQWLKEHCKTVKDYYDKCKVKS